MIRAAICDDDPLFMDMIKAKTYDYFMTAGQELDLSCYSSGTPLLLAEKEYHLYLLDIVLPEFSGLELADLIRKRNPGCTIIFISSMHNAVYDSIRYAPLRFIRKENLDTENASRFIDGFTAFEPDQAFTLRQTNHTDIKTVDYIVCNIKTENDYSILLLPELESSESESTEENEDTEETSTEED